MKPIGVDIGWTRGAGIISRLIVRLDKIPNVPHVNHVFWRFRFPPETSHSFLIYESHMQGGIQITPWLHFERAEQENKVLDSYFRRLDVTELQAETLWNVCAGLMHKKGYDKRAILGYYLWNRLAHRKKGSKFLNLHKEGRYTCNEFVVQSARIAQLEQFLLLDHSYTPNKLLLHFGG